MTIINIFVVLANIKIESKSLDEPFIEFMLNSFKARQQWIPFMGQIEKKDLK